MSLTLEQAVAEVLQENPVIVRRFKGGESNVGSVLLACVMLKVDQQHSTTVVRQDDIIQEIKDQTDKGMKYFNAR